MAYGLRDWDSGCSGSSGDFGKSLHPENPVDTCHHWWQNIQRKIIAKNKKRNYSRSKDAIMLKKLLLFIIIGAIMEIEAEALDYSVDVKLTNLVTHYTHLSFDMVVHIGSAVFM